MIHRTMFVRAAVPALLGTVSALAVAGAVMVPTGCTSAQTAFSKMQQVEQTIIDDFEAGDSDGQIAADVCTDLGGTSLTDAVCADVTTFLTGVVQALIDTGALASKPKALANAKAYQARHAAPALGAH